MQHLCHPLEPVHSTPESKRSTKPAHHHSKSQKQNKKHLHVSEVVEKPIEKEIQTTELNIEEHRPEEHYKAARYMRRSLEKRPSLLDTKLVVEIKKNNP